MTIQVYPDADRVEIRTGESAFASKRCTCEVRASLAKKKKIRGEIGFKGRILRRSVIIKNTLNDIPGEKRS